MPKNPHAVSLGRSGGLARAAKLTPERRREIAQKAANARALKEGWRRRQPKGETI
jgi:hypothetical protein